MSSFKDWIGHISTISTVPWLAWKPFNSSAYPLPCVTCFGRNGALCDTNSLLSMSFFK